MILTVDNLVRPVRTAVETDVTEWSDALSDDSCSHVVAACYGGHVVVVCVSGALILCSLCYADVSEWYSDACSS